ncbi:MAG: hypothetical protein ACOX4R_00830 [Lentihominibacter sp.]|jgi:hypothetical protein
MKKWKISFIVLGIVIMLASLHLLGYMIRVVIVLHPPVDWKLILFFATGIIGICGSITLFCVARRIS